MTKSKKLLKAVNAYQCAGQGLIQVAEELNTINQVIFDYLKTSEQEEIEYIRTAIMRISGNMQLVTDELRRLQRRESLIETVKTTGELPKHEYIVDEETGETEEVLRRITPKELGVINPNAIKEESDDVQF